MTEIEFLERLRKGLSGLPETDIEEHLKYYEEMIDDRMEDGLSEEESVEQTGNPEEIANNIIEETPISKIVKEKVRNRRPMGAGTIVLLILGSPLWLPLIISFAAVLFSIWITLWAVVVSLWAANLVIALSSPASVIGAVVFFAQGNSMQGFLAISAAFALAGLAILMFFACRFLSKGALGLTKSAALKTRRMILGKENSK